MACVCVCMCKCLYVHIVKTEAAPGCPAYTQTIPLLNHLTVPSTIHCPERGLRLTCVSVEMRDTRGEDSGNKSGRAHKNIGCQSNFRLCSLCINKTNFCHLCHFKLLHTHSHLISLLRPRSPTCSSLIFMLLTSETGMSTQIYYSNYLILHSH